MTLYTRFFLCALIGVTLPLQLAWASDAATGATRVQTVQAIPVDDQELLSQLRSIDWTALPGDQAPALSARLAADGPLLAEALAALRQAQGEQKIALSQVLAAAASPRVLEAAMQWARDPGDGERRADGWLLLRQMPPTAESLRLAFQRLDEETHEPALAQLIWSVRRVEVPRPDREAVMAVKLHRLSAHPNPRVRMASIQMLADWDRQGRFLMEDLLRLMRDTDPQVRVAAIGASGIQGQASQRVKSALLRLATRSAEDPEVRSAALLNLERFSFTQREFEAYQAAMAEVFNGSAR